MVDGLYVSKIIGLFTMVELPLVCSRRISMREIEKNDFNVNISRYVSTAKHEVKNGFKCS